MPQPPMYQVTFYEDARGDCPVQAALKQMPEAGRRKCETYINELRRRGPAMVTVSALAKRMTRNGNKKLSGNLCELRPGRYRIFYAWAGDTEFVLLHIALKDQRTLPAEIDRAEARLMEFRQRRAGRDG